MRERHAFTAEFYAKLGGVLNCEPTSLLFAVEEPLPIDSPARKFAARVAELIKEGAIPAIDEETGKSIDVVEYVWQMGDAKLETIAISLRELREAYILLRDEHGLVMERPINQGKRRLLLGRIEICQTTKEDILEDIDARLKLGIAAFERHESNSDKSELGQIQEVKETIKERFQLYEDVVKSDMAFDRDNHRYEINIPSIHRVLDADFHFRKIIFPTPLQQESFRFLFRRSRSMIDFMLLHRRPLFSSWWREARDKNTDDLRKVTDAWLLSKPDWKLMRDILGNTLARTNSMVEEVYGDER